MAQPAYHESLPYIDPEPSPAALAAARALIAAEQPPSSSSPQATGSGGSAPPPPANALDLARYEKHETSDPAAGDLASAAVAAEYLAARARHLRLLDEHGRNAWLVGNYHLAAELAALEGELARARGDVDRVNAARRAAQDAVAAEMEALERDWRRALGRVVETELAVQEVRAQIRDELKAKAAAQGP